MIVRHLRIYIYQLLCIIIISAMLYELYLFLGASRNLRRGEKRKYIYHYEAVLCKFDITASFPTKPSVKGCPKEGIVTSFMPGGLSSNMWQYANIYAAKIHTGLEGYMPVCLENVLGQVFRNLSLPLLSKIGHCSIPLPEAVTSINEWSSSEESIVIWDKDLYNFHVLENLNRIMKDFVFTRILTDFAYKLLSSLKNGTSTVTYIGMHISNTRTIIDQDYDTFYPTVQFFLDAMSEFRNEFLNTLFVVVSDRQRFWSKVFQNYSDVKVMPDTFFVDDEWTLSLLAHCNHTILSSGGIAVWGALLAGGKVIMSLSLSGNFNELLQIKETWDYLLNNTLSDNKQFKKFL